MVKKEFTYRGKKLDELKSMDIKNFIELLPARQRRSIKRGFTEQQKIFLKEIGKGKKDIETHCRDMIILPEMIGMTIRIHNGKEFVRVLIEPEMLGHVLGEFALTRRKLSHGAPGVGSTKSTAHVGMK